MTAQNYCTPESIQLVAIRKSKFDLAKFKSECYSAIYMYMAVSIQEHNIKFMLLSCIMSAGPTFRIV